MIIINYAGKPVSINNRYNRNFSLTKEYRLFKEALGWKAKEIHRESPLKCPVKVEIDLFYKGREPDADNAIKPILDSLNNIVYKDDKQVQRLSIAKFKSDKDFVTIYIKPC
jgi:Holliday junction resolvase RusA-like endonuclease